MRSLWMGILAVVATTGPTEETPRSQFESLVQEFETASNAAIAAAAEATNERERSEAFLQRPQPQQFAPRFLALAERHREDPAALDALIWVASKCSIFGTEAEKALEMIARDHSRSERLKAFCGQCSRYGEAFPPYEEMLRSVLRSNPHHEVQGAACLALADYLKKAKERTESNLIKVSIEGGPRLSDVQLMNLQKMKDRGLDNVAAESEALFRKVIEHYGDIRLENNYPAEAGKFAKGQLFVLRNLSIGSKAPEIIGKDIHAKPMRLSDHRGKVVVLDFGSHRSCGVCRQYYPHLRTMVEEFEKEPFVLLGISVDDDVKELQALAEKGEITWPIWWDGENMEGPLASQWVIRGMPTFFVLDHKGVIRNKGFIQPGEIKATVELSLKEMQAEAGS